MPRYCEYTSCDKYPTFGMHGERPRFCTTHKLVGMINLKKKPCEHDGCMTIPFFGRVGDRPRYCKLHKEIDMVDVVTKRCQSEGCLIKNPNFDRIGGNGSYCVSHKGEGMVDVRTKKCKYQNCNVKPVYDIPTGSGSYCASHKLEGMINVISKRCAHHGCNITNPNYNIAGEKGKYCVSHKLPEMVDVNTKLCKYNGCDIKATFGSKGYSPTYCKIHKEKDMFNLATKLCSYTGCSKQASYSVQKQRPTHCRVHAELGMISVYNKLCIYNGCTNKAQYGQLGKSVSHCKQHKPIGYIKRPSRRCICCKNKALWGDQHIPIHCDLHKLESEKNVVEQKCIQCGIPMLLDNTNHCECCNPAAFSKAKLLKQDALMRYLDSRNLVGNSTDSTVDSGICGRERPDRVYDISDKLIILECDENQHKYMDCACEQTRMINITQSYGGIPIYFIRWNPDIYDPGVSTKHISIKERYKAVGDLIQAIIDTRVILPNSLCSVTYMYYDGWNGSIVWSEILKYDVT